MMSYGLTFNRVTSVLQETVAVREHV